MAIQKQFSSFEEMLTSSDLPVLVDFYADWCGPCKIMSQILEQVNAQLQGKIKIAKIDTEKYPQLASQYQIYALPTLILFKNGEPIDKIEGVMQTSDLVRRVLSLI
ncbi:thioredoxin [Calothrix sp. NIES-3974]|uniref:thioredoxin n=1 Tax=Calothrix sp. NIES-3974 TaxID=2005462 RepID=UPI000B5FE91B|nr:thioredoxin [Calothrix sp. NIES-3974]BAZ07902.1 thioredoxin [Calothrix sp. NIES-3974]